MCVCVRARAGSCGYRSFSIGKTEELDRKDSISQDRYVDDDIFVVMVHTCFNGFFVTRRRLAWNVEYRMCERKLEITYENIYTR